MKKLRPILFVFFTCVLLMWIRSCESNCQTCTATDINGVSVGEFKLCGAELDQAKADTLHWTCH